MLGLRPKPATGGPPARLGYNNACNRAGLVLLHLSSVSAHPLLPRESGSGTPSANPIAIWIPVAIVGMVVAILLTLTFTKMGGKLYGRFRRGYEPNETRNVTATELTGNGAANGEATPAPVVTHGIRRHRRRPSQRSTRSLPAYKEEPGDEELVLVRRAGEDPSSLYLNDESSNDHDMADGMDEDDMDEEGVNEESEVSHDHSPASQDPHPAPASTAHPPPSEDAHRMPQRLPFTENIRPSLDTLHTDMPDSDESGASLMRADREPAPSYFEVVGPEEMQRISSELDRVQTSTSSSSSPPLAEEPRRRSGFMGIFHPRPTSIPLASPSSSSAGPSSFRQSMFVTPSSPSSPPNNRNWLHRLSTSASQPSTSLITTSTTSLLTPARSISPSASSSRHNINMLSSPSVTSLNSLAISAPLTHTLTRTEFAYPRAGPTSEQMAFISSRESLGRFGVPFGLDARAAAAASAAAAAAGSDEPPPPFEEDGNTSPHNSPRSSMESRSRSPSFPERIEEEPPSETTSPISGRSRPSPAVLRQDSVSSTSSYATAATELATPISPSSSSPTEIASPRSPTSLARLLLTQRASLPPPPATTDRVLPHLSIIPATPMTSLPATPVSPPLPPTPVVC